jgi:predicted phosphodiesterase
MRIALLSDIHSNLPALSKALELVEAKGADEIWCLGDIVGYGAHPNECVQLIAERSVRCVLGNHDQAVAFPEEPRFLPWEGKVAAEWTSTVLTEQSQRFLRSLPLIDSSDTSTIVHASPSTPSSWTYVSSLALAQEQFPRFATPLCFIGHTHVPSVCGDDLKTFSFKPGHRFLINVGSVGQPRDGNPHLSFGLLDTKAWSYQNIRADYDVNAAASAIIQKGLPRRLAERLFVGT